MIGFSRRRDLMRSVYLLPLLLAAPAATPAQPAASTVEVQLSSFDFSPAEIRLRAGQPIVLRLTNPGRGGHNFAAPLFFAAAQIPAGQNVALRNGAIEVPSRQTVSLRLTPARGDYRLRCTHTLHSSFGMRGRIVVE
jgi:plastocyanin